MTPSFKNTVSDDLVTATVTAVPLVRSVLSAVCDSGLEHEALLCDHLQQQDIPFWSEEQLKARGLFKTPDALLQVRSGRKYLQHDNRLLLHHRQHHVARVVWKEPVEGHQLHLQPDDNQSADVTLLQVPICVQHPASDSSSNSSSSWHVVHWIDSKACFGDDRTHSQQLEGQYRTYTNRYGPGLVIYWFGYVQGLESDADVLVMERFPQQQEIMQLPRLYAADNTTAAEQVVSASGAVAGVEVKVAGVADGSGADSRSTASASGSAAANALARRLSTLAC